MPKRKSELPDVDPETLNAMIGDIACELGCPHDVYPEHVDLDADPEVEGGGFNPGCVRNGVVLYREGQKWRRKALAELKRRPAWVAEWLADAEMDRRVEELCAAKGLSFAPYECPPWWVRCDEAIGHDDVWGGSKRLAQRRRRQLEAELKREQSIKG